MADRVLFTTRCHSYALFKRFKNSVKLFLKDLISVEKAEFKYLLTDDLSYILGFLIGNKYILLYT